MFSKKLDAIINEGLFLSKENRNLDAIKYFDKAIKLNPKNSLVYTYKANSLNKLEKYKKAIKYYNKSKIVFNIFILI